MARTLFDTQSECFATTPELIANRLADICQHLSPGRQEDAHEFLRHLIEQMTENFLVRHIENLMLDQYSKDTTPLNQIFGGYFRSTITCGSCKHKSETFEHFMELSLDISKVNSLKAATESFFSHENLEELTYECVNCEKKVSATKQTQLERSPIVLCVQLKRFDSNGTKLRKKIHFPLHIDLSEFFSEHANVNQRSYFKLVSLVSHLGYSSAGGHYSAVGLAPNGQYYEFDDSTVKTTKIQDVVRESDAYLLFYEVHDRFAGVRNDALHHSQHDTHPSSLDLRKSSSSTPSPLSFKENNKKASPVRHLNFNSQAAPPKTNLTNSRPAPLKTKPKTSRQTITQEILSNLSTTKAPENTLKEKRPPPTPEEIERRKVEKAKRLEKALAHLNKNLVNESEVCGYHPEEIRKQRKTEYAVSAAEKTKSGKRQLQEIPST